MAKTVADRILEVLAASGVRHIFGVIGDAVFPLADALSRQQLIRYIPTGTENGAALAAAYSAKFSGGLGVCLGTSGPGAASLVNGTAAAFLDRAPLLCLTGQVPSHQFGTNTKQFLPQEQLFAPVTAGSRLCIHPQTIQPLLVESILTALEKRHSVHLAIPKDVLAMPVPDEPQALPMLPTLISPTYEKSGVIYGDLAPFAEILPKANRPLVVIGPEMRAVTDGPANLRQLAEQWGAAIVLTQEAKGILPDSDPLVIGGIGPAYLPECWNESDLFLLFGTSAYEKRYFPPGAVIWQFDNAVHPDYSNNLRIRGDFTTIIARLKEITPSPVQCTAWRAKINAAHQGRQEAVARQNGDHPGAICKLLAGCCAPDAIFALDVGEFIDWFNLSFTAERQAILHSTNWRGMGCGIPAGIAACCQAPGRQVIALVGDGGFMMALPELSTVTAHRFPLTVLVLRNQVYGLEEQKMKKEGFAVFGTALTLPDMVKLGESFGIAAYRLVPADRAASKEILQKALAAPPALVEIPVTTPALPFL